MDESGITRDRFATRFAERVLAARWAVILIALLVVAAAGSGIARLEFSANYRIFFDGDNPQLLALEALENTYGKNENLVFLIVPDDGNATSETALAAAVWLTDKAWRTPFSRRVDSLANFQYTTADGDDLYVRDLVDPQELDRAEARARIRAVASSDPRIAGSMLARNGDVSVVNVTVELPEEGLLEAVAEVAEFGRSAAAEAEERFPGIDLRLVGTVMVNQTFLEALDREPDDLPAREPSAHGPGPWRPHPRLGGGRGDRGGDRLFHSRVRWDSAYGPVCRFPRRSPRPRPSS